MTPDIKRRTLLQGLLWLPIAGCSLSPALTRFGEQLDLAVRGFPDAPVTRDYVEELPYASMQAKIGSGPRSLVILSQADGHDYYWMAADRTVFVTRLGRLVQTAGLPDQENLSATHIRDGEALRLLQPGRPLVMTRWVDFQYLKVFSAEIQSYFDFEAEETIEILERRYATRRYRERNICQALDWAFDNYYWADRDTGFIWKSRQHAAPDLPEFELAVTKPVGV